MGFQFFGERGACSGVFWLIFRHDRFEVELLNDAATFFGVFLESVVTKPLPGSRVQYGLIDTGGSAALL